MVLRSNFSGRLHCWIKNRPDYSKRIESNLKRLPHSSLEFEEVPTVFCFLFSLQVIADITIFWIIILHRIRLGNLIKVLFHGAVEQVLQNEYCIDDVFISDNLRNPNSYRNSFVTVIESYNNNKTKYKKDCVQYNLCYTILYTLCKTNELWKIILLQIRVI